MLVPWRVADPCREPRHILDHFSANPFPNEIQNPKTNCFHSENSNKITQKLFLTSFPFLLDEFMRINSSRGLIKRVDSDIPPGLHCLHHRSTTLERGAARAKGAAFCSTE